MIGASAEGEVRLDLRAVAQLPDGAAGAPDHVRAVFDCEFGHLDAGLHAAARRGTPLDPMSLSLEHGSQFLLPERLSVALG